MELDNVEITGIQLTDNPMPYKEDGEWVCYTLHGKVPATDLYENLPQ